MRVNCIRNNNQILHGDQTRCEVFFTRSTTNAHLTHDLFAAVNILVVYYAPPPSYGGIMH